MTIDPRPTGDSTPNGDPARRKFDDVASLFVPIVPGSGEASRFPPHRPAFIPMPPTYTAPVRRPEPEVPQEASAEEPDAEPSENFAETVRIATVPHAPADTAIVPAAIAQRIDPPPLARPRPTEIPWPDAFEPRPNYRKRESRNWSWLLLIPAGLVAAAAITMVDPRAVRSWIDTTILHRTPIVGTMDSPLLPSAFRPTPKATTAATTPPAQETVPYPALPTSPVPVPPGTEVSPPPPDPAEAAAATAAAANTPIRVTIQFRRNIPGADGEARRIAALLQSYGGSVELHPNTATARVATINYYNAPDKDAATALATTLANEASSWVVRLGPTKNPPGTLDVWLP